MAFLQNTGGEGNGRGQRQPLFNAPLVVTALTALIVAAHVARILLPGDGPDIALLSLALIPARYAPEILAANGIGPQPLYIQIGTLFSHMFVHGGFTHLVLNSVALLAFGTPVARWLGAARFLLLFFLCGLAGAAVHIAIAWGSLNPAVGASGAISGMMGAVSRMLYSRFDAEMGTRRLAPIADRRVMAFTIILMIANVVTAYLGIGTGGDGSLIAWDIHLGGYLFGLTAVGLFAVRPRRPAKV